MIVSAFIALAFILQATHPSPAPAQSFAECQAWLCLPAGYDVRGGSPTTACEPARQAVLRRLRLRMDPLPSWSSCAARFGWNTANLNWTQPTDAPCPHGGSVNAGGMCQGTDADGCTYTYSPRESGNVWVHVDGPRTGSPHRYTLADAGARNVECPPDIDGGPGPGLPPGQVVGPALPTAPVGGVGGGVGAAPN